MQNIENLLLFSGEDYLRVSKGLVRTLGVECAFMFAELVDEYLYYYKQKYDILEQNNGWFYSTADNIKERTSWSADKQEKIIKILIEKNLIQKKLAGVPARRFFYINSKEAQNLVAEYHETSFRKKRQLDSAKNGNLSQEKTETIIRKSNEGNLITKSKQEINPASGFLNKKEIPVSADFTHTQNYEEIIENFMKEKYPELPEITASTLRRFVGCMIAEQSKKDNKKLNRDEISEIFADIIIKLFPDIQVKPEIPAISILENVAPTVKKSLTVQSVEVGQHELKAKEEITHFVENYNNGTFDNLESHLITEYISKRKEVYKSKVKNTKQALTGLLNSIIETRKQFPLEWIFEADNGCYKRSAISGDATKPFQTIKPEYYKAQQQPQSKRQRVNYNNLQPLEFQELKID